ncbi:unnamed protein product [Amoebophrya sp. A120]|nr:unnamed protein product [Amoebophrya sp. A120]|eukprot:GSA120T00009199001.1
MGKKKGGNKESGGKSLTALEVYDEVKMRFEVRKQTERGDLYETSFKDLKKKNEILKSQYYSQRDTQADILKTLKTNLEEQYGKVDKYEMLIEQLHRSMDDNQEQIRKEAVEKDEMWSLKLQEAQAKIDDLQTALEGVKSYIKKRNEMQENLEQLEQKLKEKDEQRDNEVAQLDRKKAMEIDQLKKDMLARIRDTRDSLRLKTKEQLDVITKRTIMENEQMSSELAFQRKEVEKVVTRSKHLSEENAKLRRNMELHTELEEELAKRTHVYQKLIKKLNTKVEGLEAKVDELQDEQNYLNKHQSASPNTVEMSVNITNTEILASPKASHVNTALQKEATSRSAKNSARNATETVTLQSNKIGNNFVNSGNKPSGSSTSSSKPSGAAAKKGPGYFNNPNASAATSSNGNSKTSAGNNAAASQQARKDQASGSSPRQQSDPQSNASSPVDAAKNQQDGAEHQGVHGSGGAATSHSSSSSSGNHNKPAYLPRDERALLQAEIESLRRRLEQSTDELKRFRRDHLAVLNLSDHATRMIILELYELKRAMDDSATKEGSLDTFFEREELALSGFSANQNPFMLANQQQQIIDPGQHIFTQLTNKQRQSFFRFLLEKLVHKRLEPKTRKVLDAVLQHFSTANASTQTTPDHAGDIALVPPVPRGPRAQNMMTPLYHDDKVRMVRGEVRQWGSSAAGSSGAAVVAPGGQHGSGNNGNTSSVVPRPAAKRRLVLS